MMTGNWHVRRWALLVFVGALCSPLIAEPLDALLDKMNSDEFDVRSKAYAELEVWAKKNLESSPEELHKLWNASRQPEVRSRCYELMKETAIQRKFGKGKGFIGIRMQEIAVDDPADKGQEKKEKLAGIQITFVLVDTPGEKAGLKINDTILGVDTLEFGKTKIPPANARFGFQQTDFGAVTRFGNYIRSKQPDETVTLHILRGVKEMDVKVTLMKRPASADVRMFGGQEVNPQDEQDRFFKTWLKSMAK
ncbi:MAG TPA: hypothetical protein DEP88_00905 [Verrucomicrobiales bacterium]|jgi:C-terminal processing protease CtpA/Prc|nr:hypothetical protein [Verrucomicrobiales bacterium]HCI91311.1 hypothetical protein [Verrucomicrobiales bacterium]HCL98015.1 hypothetical protein [Verrucomicrobiales bacterium]